jgi:UDP-glucose 4-epimerase
MHVLVTGGAGFLGGHLVEALVARDHRVAIIDNLSTGVIDNVPSQVRFFKHDVRHPLDALFERVRPDIVMHLAAQISVPASVAFPLDDLATNVGGTVNVMQAAARHKVRKVIAVSSAAVYGVPSTLPLDEKSPLGPVSPYGLSKLTAEAYIRLLGQQLGVSYTILRPANLYGPRQQPDGEGAVVPAFLSRFGMGSDPVIHGDGSQTRDFVFVKDMAEAMVQAIDHADSLTLNVSSGVGTSVLRLWQMLAHLTGWNRPPKFGPARPGDIPHSVLAADLAQEKLTWRPKVTIEEGLRTTVLSFSSAEVAASRLDI